MPDVCTGRDRIEQKRSVAMRRVALIAQKRARLFGRQLRHLRSLDDRFRQFQLTRVDSLEIGVPSRPRGRPSVGWRAERAEMDIFDSGFRERVSQWGLRKSRTPRIGYCAHIDDPLDARPFERGEKLRDRRTFISDGEDPHSAPLRLNRLFAKRC